MRPSIAHAWLSGPVTYSTPSITIGVASNLFDDAGLEGPLRGELPDVGRRDLRQRAEALAGVVARVRQPARRIGEAVQRDPWS